MQPQLWQRVQQLEGGPGDGAEAVDGVDGSEELVDGEEGVQRGAPAGGSGSYDYPVVSMALKVRTRGQRRGS